MIIALLVCLAATVTTGLMGYGEQSKGPLAAVLVTDATANGKPRALNFPVHKEVGLGGGLEIVRVIGVCTTRRWRNPSDRAILCVVPAMIVVWQNLRKKRWWWIR